MDGPTLQLYSLEVQRWLNDMTGLKSQKNNLRLKGEERALSIDLISLIPLVKTIKKEKKKIFYWFICLYPGGITPFLFQQKKE